jgi:hypothetical protein
VAPTRRAGGSAPFNHTFSFHASDFREIVGGNGIWTGVLDRGVIQQSIIPATLQKQHQNPGFAW